jgi:hypothetical protein
MAIRFPHAFSLSPNLGAFLRRSQRMVSSRDAYSMVTGRSHRPTVDAINCATLPIYRGSDPRRSWTLQIAKRRRKIWKLAAKWRGLFTS